MDRKGERASKKMSPGAGWRITWTVVTLIVVETLVCGIAMTPVTWAWVELARATAGRPALRAFIFALAAVPSYAVFGSGLLILTPLAIRLTGWRTPVNAALRIADLEWPLLGWVRFMALLHVPRLLAGGLLKGTPLWTFHLRLCGARMGRRVYVNSLFISDYNLLTFDDDVVVGGGVHLSGHTVEGGVVKTGRVHLGRGVTVGLDSIVEIDVEISEGCQVGAMSFVPKHARLTEPGIYVGVPVARLSSER